MSACPGRETALHALLDGELDAANSLECERHLEACPGCAAVFRRLQAQRAALRAAPLRHSAPPDLRRGILGAIEEAAPRRRRPGWREWSLGASGLALAASIALVLLLPPAQPGLRQELVADHVRSMLGTHLTDIAASDQHVVKPWFDGKVDFSPPVPDLAAEGFPLLGGRLDYVGGRVVAALVYRRQRHVINVFVWPAPEAPGAPTAPSLSAREGYNVLHWTGGGMQFWAVSDLNVPELRQFVQMLSGRAPD